MSDAAGADPMHRIGLAGALFTASVAGLAALSLVYGNFAPLLAPFAWPKAWTYGLGALLLAACAGLLWRATVAGSAVIVAACAAAWAVRGVPPILHAPLSVGSWYGFSEAVSVLVGVGTLYALGRRFDAGGAAPDLMGEGALRAGRILLGGACVVWGLAHFAYAAYSFLFVPEWFPARMALVYLTGACHAAAGVALILGILPRLAAALEAIMIGLFGVLVWIPTYFAHPVPKWAGSPQNQWSETFLNFALAAVAWLIAVSCPARERRRPVTD